MKKVLAIAGSLRTSSYNKALCEYFVSQSSDSCVVELFTLNNVPFFNEDLEGAIPSEALALIEAVRSADGLIVATPEYNNMISGALKNALEWLSRGYSADALINKPVLIAGATLGGFGTVRAQNQLLLLLSILGAKVDPSFRVPVSNAAQVFTDGGAICDADLENKLKDIFDKFISTI